MAGRQIHIDTSDLVRVMKQIGVEGQIRGTIANRIVQKEFKVLKVNMARRLRNYSALPIRQGMRRIKLTKGRPRAPQRQWVYRAIKVAGTARVIHPGRLRSHRVRRKQGGIVVEGRLIKRAFYYNPPGKKLKGEKRRILVRRGPASAMSSFLFTGIRKAGGKASALKAREIGKPNIPQVWVLPANRHMADRAAVRITHQILKRAILLRGKVSVSARW